MSKHLMTSNTGIRTGRRPRPVQRLPTPPMLAALASLALADSTGTRCDVYPISAGLADLSIPFTFSRRQGHTAITRSDGRGHELSASGNRVGAFNDTRGRAVYRQSGLGDQGLILLFPDDTLHLHRRPEASAHGESSVVVESPREARFTSSFMTRYFQATNREGAARWEGDSWIVESADGDVWTVPTAIIAGD